MRIVNTTIIAFINPNKTKNVAQLLDADAGMNCLIGLSFDLLSEVNNNIIAAFGNTTLGQTPLSNIFDQNPSLPNCLDIHLQRSDDLESTGSGLILIGEHSDEHGNITAQPILNTVAETEWVVEVDAITVAGKSLKFEKSAVPGLGKSNKLGGLLDSGSSALILPDKMVNEVFKSIPNSFYSKEQGTWIVDCLSSTNVSITMGCVAAADVLFSASFTNNLAVVSIITFTRWTSLVSASLKLPIRERRRTLRSAQALLTLSVTLVATDVT